MGMKAYPAYKESGIPWFGKVPKHWHIIKLRNLLHKFSQKGNPDLPLLSVVRERGVILRDVTSKEENHNFIPDDLSKYKVLLDGQFVINKMKAWQGSYAVSTLTGIVSPAYFIYNIDYSNLLPRFFNVAIRSKAYISFFNQSSDGVRIGQWDLDETKMRNIPFLVPTKEEQQAIVAYLDKKCAEIEELISRRQAIIERLKELKQSIIAEAVTKGLNPKAPMKESGSEWIGKIPVHWELEPLKRFCIPIKNKNSSLCHNNALQFRYGEIIEKSDINKSDLDYLKTISEYNVIHTNDIVINGLNLNYDFVSQRVAISTMTGIITSAYIAMEVNHDISSKYLTYLLKNFDSQKLFHGLGKGVRITLTYKILSRILITFPPDEEQKAIVSYLDKKCSEIDALISRHEQTIEKLKELKTATIADVVTGKVDVRDSI